MDQDRCYNSPSDSLTGLSEPLPNATLLDFWKWAFCDLCDDDVKGIFAEWTVAKLLNYASHRRISWANSDLVTETGIRIEVKASAFQQSWKLIDEHGLVREQPKPIKNRDGIRFSGLRARDASGDFASKDKRHKSDIYVFAFQHEESATRWNAMDLRQWEFYVLESDKLQVDSISLKALSRKCKALNAHELSPMLNEAIASQEAHRKAISS